MHLPTHFVLGWQNLRNECPQCIYWSQINLASESTKSIKTQQLALKVTEFLFYIPHFCLNQTIWEVRRHFGSTGNQVSRRCTSIRNTDIIYMIYSQHFIAHSSSNHANLPFRSSEREDTTIRISQNIMTRRKSLLQIRARKKPIQAGYQGASICWTLPCMAMLEDPSMATNTTGLDVSRHSYLRWRPGDEAPYQTAGAARIWDIRLFLSKIASEWL
jgi:hypothetical protein